jgi:hypothetical protein
VAIPSLGRVGGEKNLAVPSGREYGADIDSALLTAT